MDKVKVGEYIRTKSGIIAKITKINTNNHYYFDKVVLDKFAELSEKGMQLLLKKHSFVTSELVEKGDYVNGEKIVKIEEDIYIGGLNLWTERTASDGFGGFYQIKYREKDINSILTKEQFNNHEYEVK